MDEQTKLEMLRLQRAGMRVNQYRSLMREHMEEFPRTQSMFLLDVLALQNEGRQINIELMKLVERM